ncbi:MAG: septation protein A [Candidatus Berkiellales bacterium]
MKLFYDLWPLLAFFVAFKFYGIFAATAVVIAAVILQVGVTVLRGKRPEVMHLVTLGMVVILGGATLLFQNEIFIKWKPTAVYWLLALLFWGSPVIAKKNLVKKILEKSLTLPDKIWQTLNMTWYSFFFFMGILNLIIVYSFDTNTWVYFKLFGTLILTVVFVIVQGVVISKHLPQTEKKNLPDIT